MQSLNIILIGCNGLLGSSVASHLISHGHQLFLGDISADPVDIRFKQQYLQVDILDDSSLANFFDCASKKLPHIDCFLPLAYPRPQSWGTAFEDLDAASLSLNLFAQIGSTINASRHAIDLFKKQRFGNLILFSSIQGVCAPKFDHYIGTSMSCPIEYVAAKSGIIAITKYLAKYYKEYNIRVNCISPGGILNNQDTSFIQKYNSDCLSRGLLDPKDINCAIDFLVSQENWAFNGQNLIVDDGWSL